MLIHKSFSRTDLLRVVLYILSDSRHINVSSTSCSFAILAWLQVVYNQNLTPSTHMSSVTQSCWMFFSLWTLKIGHGLSLCLQYDIHFVSIQYEFVIYITHSVLLYYFVTSVVIYKGDVLKLPEMFVISGGLFLTIKSSVTVN